ncbi:alanine racemase [Alteromonas pelagimontana]|uniref:Alanine racemase n=1 Tax=Alteromonas pelagimontana TaxID=1858656 RepID=A0A6M4MB98_9ALTE|nr:alanine racemase [Alteromonas pelagimontana]QJR80462.1 alanine racemase [Alteromonas pelagimontana]
MSRQTQAIIHADAIISNFSRLTSLAVSSKTMAVIKADAYGHGAVNVAHILKDHASCFAVALLEEARLLRNNNITAPIVVLEGPHQAQECAQAKHLNCILVVHNRQQLQWLKQLPKAVRPTVWLKVDSGMHRLGFACHEVGAIVNEFGEFFDNNTVLVTHLACADDVDNAFTAQQIAAFADVVRQTQFPVSIANSPATVGWPQSHGDWNRIGLAMFGSEPLSRGGSSVALAPAMTLGASVIAVRKVKKGESVGYGQNWYAPRDSIIATVGIGYADGYPRHCPNGTPVWVNGLRVPLVGRVSMDMITIDVTEVKKIACGDAVELWGANICIDEIAKWAGTISYELMTRVSPRVPRIVVPDFER